MPVLLWGVLALAVGLAAIWVGIRMAMPVPDPLPADVKLPATPLQRASWWSLGIGVALGACAAGVLLFFGPEATYDTDGVRLVFTLLILATVVALGGGTIWIKREAGRGSSVLDERDLAILGRAPAVQGIAVILTLAVWVVGLVERFNVAGAVPLFYLILLFWSCLVIFLLGLPMGVLLGYRRR